MWFNLYKYRLITQTYDYLTVREVLGYFFYKTTENHVPIVN